MTLLPCMESMHVRSGGVLALLQLLLVREGVVAQDAGNACASVALGPADVICLNECDPVAGVCTCAAHFDQIESGGSCSSVCASFGMTCSGRHSDGPSNGRHCIYFASNTFPESCDAIGDNDDICVCSRPIGTRVPTQRPTRSPTLRPTHFPTSNPIAVPTLHPTFLPSMLPTRTPSSPTAQPTATPESNEPTVQPTSIPTRSPTQVPSAIPTKVPSTSPTSTAEVTAVVLTWLREFNREADDCEAAELAEAINHFLSVGGTAKSNFSSCPPSAIPTAAPTPLPTSAPTPMPSVSPTAEPSVAPIATPTPQPTAMPVAHPTSAPTESPTTSPSNSPSAHPTSHPTRQPTQLPTQQPSDRPTPRPTLLPTSTNSPTRHPTPFPSKSPTRLPSKSPTAPTAAPSRHPTRIPTRNPTHSPTRSPTEHPTLGPAEIPTITVTGELRRWHKVTVDVQGPPLSENGQPNPFLDYRFQAVFTHSGGSVKTVEGYFAADGSAAETGASAGQVFRAHLTPGLIGNWTVRAMFTQGTNAAISEGGTVVPGVDGLTTTFVVAETDKSGADLRGKGMLLPVTGERYLQFRGSGERFLKAGADSPENLLGYYEFDGTFDAGGLGPSTTDGLHHFDTHLSDWRAGDPSWRGGKGKRLIGALNYLAQSGANAVSFLTYNYGGDGSDVWPLVSPTDRVRYDCSKLDQWEIVFSHADRLGLYLHFKTQETEVDTSNFAFDGSGAVGTEHRLYIRELIARFGHHLALNWNLGEENTQTTAQQTAMASTFRNYDPYHHNIVMHTHPALQTLHYAPHLGMGTLTGVSVQSNANNVHADVKRWVTLSAQAGQPWVVANDEQGNALNGIYPDDSYPSPSDFNKRMLVGQVLYGTLMAGGAGVEAYFGYSHHNNDLNCENWRTRDEWWRYGRFALNLFSRVPYWTMSSDDGLVRSGDYCFAARGSVYMVYHHSPMDASTVLNLAHTTGTYTVEWYDPQTGVTFTPNPATVSAGAAVSYPAPPSRSGQHWVALFTRESASLILPTAKPIRSGQGADKSSRNTVSISGAACAVVIAVVSILLIASKVNRLWRRPTSVEEEYFDN